MILKNQLYTINSRTAEGDSTVFNVSLNPECFIYKAHFPGNPITPGVCIVQTARELLSEITGKNLEISEAKDIRFMNILSPVNNKDVDFVFSGVAVSEDNVKSQVSIKKGDEIFATISFTCVCSSL